MLVLVAEEEALEAWRAWAESAVEMYQAPVATAGEVSTEEVSRVEGLTADSEADPQAVAREDAKAAELLRVRPAVEDTLRPSHRR